MYIYIHIYIYIYIYTYFYTYIYTHYTQVELNASWLRACFRLNFIVWIGWHWHSCRRSSHDVVIERAPVSSFGTGIQSQGRSLLQGRLWTWWDQLPGSRSSRERPSSHSRFAPWHQRENLQETDPADESVSWWQRRFICWLHGRSLESSGCVEGTCYH